MLEGLKVRNGCSFAVMLHINADWESKARTGIIISKLVI